MAAANGRGVGEGEGVDVSRLGYPLGTDGCG